jgi:GR25 family glycosyltransferase involved in LPS biosynthesis
MEAFDYVENIDYYIITMGNEDRVENINKQQQKINKYTDKINIQFVDAVVGKTLDLNELKQTGKLAPNCDNNFSFGMKNEIGCYLSHMKIYDIINQKNINKNNTDGYSVIFEDDVELKEDFIELLDKSIIQLNNIEFDYLFLGMLNGIGEKLVDNIYHLGKEGEMYQTHAYLVKNSSIQKIIDNLMPIEYLIDVAIFNKGKSEDFKIYRLDPTIADQGGFGTLIRTN